MNPDAIEKIKNWLGSGSINIFGLPFSGKDTQGKRLAEAFNASLLGGGEILRQSKIDQNIKSAVDKGNLAPTQEYLKIVMPYLSRPEFQGKPLILSSLGRWHGEEPGVIKATTESNHPLQAVVFLRISEEEVWERWAANDPSAGHDRGNRDDDDAKALGVRLNEFRNKTLPVIEFYREKDLLIELDGSADSDKVFDEIIGKLLAFTKA